MEKKLGVVHLERVIFSIIFGKYLYKLAEIEIFGKWVVFEGDVFKVERFNGTFEQLLCYCWYEKIIKKGHPQWLLLEVKRSKRMLYKHIRQKNEADIPHEF